MKRNIIFYIFLIFFIFSIETVYAGTSVSVIESPVFGGQASIYNTTGENYKLEIGKTSFPSGGTESYAPAEQTYYIENLKFPIRYTRTRKIFRFLNSSYLQTPVIGLDDQIHKTQTIEIGPTRVVLYFENKTSNTCVSSPEVVCVNWTVYYYLYPRKYFAKYYIEGNFTGVKIDSYGFLWEWERIDANTPNNFTYWGAVENLQGTLNSSGGLFPTGSKTFTAGFNNSYGFLWNETHNKTMALAGTFSGFTYNNPFLEIGNNQNYTDLHLKSWWTATGPATFFNATNVSFGYMMWFGNSGGGSLEKNHTVNDELNDTYLDYYYPASVTNITGSYQNFSKETGTYNFTVDSSGLLRFNFSTGSYSRTYPVFHIKDTTSTASSYKDHVWYKNYSQSNAWQKLNNYTDFVIQDGNSSYFGYNYILLLINKTLGSDYEFWIDDNNDPPLTGYTTLELTSKKAWWNDSITASGQASYQSEPFSGASVSLTVGNKYCTNTTDSNGYWICKFNVPNELGSYTVSVSVSKSGNTFTNSTNLEVKASYGEKPIGTIDRIVYEIPILIQELSGRIKQVWARIMIWRG